MRFSTAWIGRLARKLSLLRSIKGPQNQEKATLPEQGVLTDAVTTVGACRVEHPLRDVRSLVSSHGFFIKNSAEVAGFIQSLGVVSALDSEWMSSACNPQTYIGALKNVTLQPGCKVLLDAEGIAHHDEMEMAFRVFSHRPKRWEMELLGGPILRFEHPPFFPGVIPAGIHLTGEHEANYFHWVCEILPRLYLYEKMLLECDVPLLVSDGLNQNLYELMDIICSKKRTIKKLTPGMAYRVAHLIYPSDVSRILDVYDHAPNNESTYLPVGLLKDMVETIKGSIVLCDEDNRKRIFVRRSSTYRKLLNEIEIEEFLIEYDFFPIDPGQLSVLDQIRIFSQADVIVGPSGAAITNILWCHNGAKVLILHSDHPFKKYPYWDALSRVAGADISYISGPRANNVDGFFQAHDDFNIRIDDLKRAVENYFPF